MGKSFSSHQEINMKPLRGLTKYQRELQNQCEISRKQYQNDMEHHHYLNGNDDSKVSIGDHYTINV